MITSVEHQVFKAARFEPGMVAVLSDQQVGSAPNAEVGNHLVSLSTISRNLWCSIFPTTRRPPLPSFSGARSMMIPTHSRRGWRC